MSTDNPKIVPNFSGRPARIAPAWVFAPAAPPSARDVGQAPELVGTLPLPDLQPEDKVAIRCTDWDVGEVTLKGRVIRWTSETHVKVRVDDGHVFAVPAIDCTLVERSGRAA